MRPVQFCLFWSCGAGALVPRPALAGRVQACLLGGGGRPARGRPLSGRPLGCPGCVSIQCVSMRVGGGLRQQGPRPGLPHLALGNLVRCGVDGRGGGGGREWGCAPVGSAGPEGAARARGWGFAGFAPVRAPQAGAEARPRWRMCWGGGGGMRGTPLGSGAAILHSCGRRGALAHGTRMPGRAGTAVCQTACTSSHLPHDGVNSVCFVL